MVIVGVGRPDYVNEEVYFIVLSICYCGRIRFELIGGLGSGDGARGLMFRASVRVRPVSVKFDG